MLDYLPVGSHGDPVLDFSRLTRDQTAALVKWRAKISLTAVARTLASFVGPAGHRIDALELLGKHYKLYVDPHEQDFGGAGLAARFE